MPPSPKQVCLSYLTQFEGLLSSIELSNIHLSSLKLGEHNLLRVIYIDLLELQPLLSHTIATPPVGVL